MKSAVRWGRQKAAHSPLSHTRRGMCLLPCFACCAAAAAAPAVAAASTAATTRAELLTERAVAALPAGRGDARAAAQSERARAGYRSKADAARARLTKMA